MTVTSAIADKTEGFPSFVSSFFPPPLFFIFHLRPFFHFFNIFSFFFSFKNVFSFFQFFHFSISFIFLLFISFLFRFFIFVSLTLPSLPVPLSSPETSLFPTSILFLRLDSGCEKKKKERTNERPCWQKQVPFQSHAQDLFVIRVRGNPSLRFIVHQKGSVQSLACHSFDPSGHHGCACPCVLTDLFTKNFHTLMFDVTCAHLWITIASLFPSLTVAAFLTYITSNARRLPSHPQLLEQSMGKVFHHFLHVFHCVGAQKHIVRPNDRRDPFLLYLLTVDSVREAAGVVGEVASNLKIGGTGSKEHPTKT